MHTKAEAAKGTNKKTRRIGKRKSLKHRVLVMNRTLCVIAVNFADDLGKTRPFKVILVLDAVKPPAVQEVASHSSQNLQWPVPFQSIFLQGMESLPVMSQMAIRSH